MTKFNAVVAVAAAALLSGPAWAASLQPAAGDAPLFNRASAAASTLQRQSVQADAARHMPAAGQLNARAATAPASMLTRADVREALQQALAHGFHVKVGERS